ncbi:hypothetical protein HPP92_000692 [Vanilla planifolia]|uniref:Zinc finger AN1 and C2H2 domain-containing stress-associated protein 16 n=1 Tax=Vanilla planifolia TaxID=51239 RepID=A0A835VKP7_VANPL|nr:hypothetical protein HPP92_000692 [Vanilla planifolia]
MGTPAFPNLGKHCSVEDCKLIDFLPFTCDRCDEAFCLQHRSYAKHQCPNANQMDVTVLICPLCAQGVRLVPNEDPNITWDIHVNGDCDPSNYQKITKKKRCPVPGCKRNTGIFNTVRCKDCTQEYCLRHRFGPEHKCPGAMKPNTNPRGQKKGYSLSNQTSTASSKWGSSLLNAASSLMASAEAGVQRLSIATNQALQKAKDGISHETNGGLVEQCLACQARFTNVNALIEHTERVHGCNQSHGRVVVDVCPRCSKAFRDPVLLVEHVEKAHGGSSRP